MTDRETEFRAHMERCTKHVEDQRVIFQPGERHEKVLFHHCDLHCPAEPTGDIHFTSCVFWGCRYFKGETEVPNIYEAMGGERYVEVSAEDKRKAINAEGFRLL